MLELPPATFFAQEPDIDLVPPTLEFQTTAVGSYADLTFNLRNAGAAGLHVGSLELVGLNKAAYRLVSAPSVPVTVAALTGSRTATVRFTATSPQSYNYTSLAIGSDDPDEPVVELAFTGAGQCEDDGSLPKGAARPQPIHDACGNGSRAVWCKDDPSNCPGNSDKPS